MSRDPYNTRRDLVDDDVDALNAHAEEARSLLDIGKLLVVAIGVLARAVADVADATRREQ